MASPRDSRDRELAGLPAYYADPRPYPKVCACTATPACAPGWYDAGCPFHGVTSLIGTWEYMKEAEDFRRALMPGPRKSRFNIKWGD